MNIDYFAKKLGYANKWWFLKDVIFIILFLSVVANYWINERSYCYELVKWYNKTCPILPKDYNPFNSTLDWNSSIEWNITVDG